MKAMFKIRNIIYQSDIKTKSTLHLFDTLVRPIATYGCEVWGAYTTKAGLFLNDSKLDGFHSMMFDKLDLRLCKSILKGFIRGHQMLLLGVILAVSL